MDFFLDINLILAFLTLTVLEIVLGIDNIIFISILVSKLPKEQQDKGRILGLLLALITRILLLLSLTWIMKLTSPLFVLFEQEISGRDIILILGGFFLLYKSTIEIHEKFEEHVSKEKTYKTGSFINVLLQIAVLDIIFSLDSVITAVGMVSDLGLMIGAIIIAIIFMILFSKSISQFIDENPSFKILALSFLILVGVVLIAEGLDQHIPKGYIYFSMAFSFMVEFINMKLHSKHLKTGVK